MERECKADMSTAFLSSCWWQENWFALLTLDKDTSPRTLSRSKILSEKSLMLLIQEKLK